MKTVITTPALLIGSQGFASPFTNGSYKGEGLWKSTNEKGVYQTSAIIANDSILAKYTLPDGSERTWDFSMRTTGSGFFKVMSNGAEVGKGYCLEHAKVCHYELVVPSLKLEETIVQEEATIYRFGSKDLGQGPISWQESLSLESTVKE